MESFTQVVSDGVVNTAALVERDVATAASGFRVIDIKTGTAKPQDDEPSWIATAARRLPVAGARAAGGMIDAGGLRQFRVGGGGTGLLVARRSRRSRCATTSALERANDLAYVAAGHGTCSPRPGRLPHLRGLAVAR